MKEFMLIIRNESAHFSSLSSEQQSFWKNAGIGIDHLKKEGKLIGAQPLERQGKMISGSTGKWKDNPFNEAKEVIVGYYHIHAKDLEDAVAIAKANPEFEYGTTARVEVRPVKVKEESTGYVYPKLV